MNHVLPKSLIIVLGVSFLLISACKSQGGPNPELSSSNPTTTQNGGGSSGDGGDTVGEGGESGNIGNGGNNGGSDGGTIGGWFTDNFVQESFTEKYDFLWIVDNSGSMSNIRTYMSQILTDFVNVLQSRRTLDWQMAVTITDHRTKAGDLISSANGTRVVRHDTVNASAEWASLISRVVNTSYSGWEQGLESGRAAVETYGNEFSRSQTPLVVTYITDEEDYSCESNCNNFNGLPENQTGWIAFPTSRYINHFNQKALSNGAAVIVYPIVHLQPLGGNNPCDDDYGYMGGRYISVQQGVGTGQSMSLCSSDLANSFNTVAQLTANLGVCFVLGHSVISTNGMEVTVDNNSVPQSSTNGYIYEQSSNHVCFSGSYIPGNGSIVRVRYNGL